MNPTTPESQQDVGAELDSARAEGEVLKKEPADSPTTDTRVWRSLEELERAPDFEEWLHREFPRQAAVWPEGVDRRSFLQLSGASIALAGLTACTKQPLEKIVPWGEQVENIVPGEPLYFATALTVDG